MPERQSAVFSCAYDIGNDLKKAVVACLCIHGRHEASAQDLIEEVNICSFVIYKGSKCFSKVR